MIKCRSISVFSIVIIGALLLSVFGNATAQDEGEGYIISKNSNYSTSDLVFDQTDTIYMKIWSDVVGDNPKTKKWEITDSQAHKESGGLSPSGDPVTFVASTPASNFALGPATLKMELRAGKNNYKVTETITISAGGPQPPPAPSWIEPDSTNDNTPHIYWESVTDPNGDTVYYSIKIGTTSDGSEFLGETSTGTNAYYDVTLSMSDITYYVNVKSSDGVLQSDWHEEEMVVDTNLPDKWTFMVYLAGDNSLSDQTTDDLNEMQSVGSTNDVNIVVLEDKLGGGNTHAYYVNSGSLTEIALNNIDPAWVDEVNMGDPDTLSSFGIYMIDNYPAQHYLLSLWDHGDGWTVVCQDETSGNDWLTMGEVDTALSDIKAANSNTNLDVLGYDACLMGMIECSYEVYDLIDYFVASEEVVPWDGWPYDDILEHLTATPTMSPADLSITIVNDYLAFYKGVNYVTISALDMSKLPVLCTAIDNFANLLFPKCETDYNTIDQALRGADSFHCSADRDIYGFAENIKKNFRNDNTIKAAAQNVMNAVDNAIIAEGHGRNHRKAHGVSIWFPDFFLSPSYKDLDFAVDHQWDEFLDEFIRWYGF